MVELNVPLMNMLQVNSFWGSLINKTEGDHYEFNI